MMYAALSPPFRLSSLERLTDEMRAESVTFPTMYSLSLSPPMTSISLSPGAWYLCLTRTVISSMGSIATSLEIMYMSVDTSLAHPSQILITSPRDLMPISSMADVSWPQARLSSGNS